MKISFAINLTIKLAYSCSLQSYRRFIFRWLCRLMTRSLICRCRFLEISSFVGTLMHDNFTSSFLRGSQNKAYCFASMV